MLRKTRILLALLVGFVMTLMFLDFSGNITERFGFLAKIQFLPALLAGSVLIWLGIVVVTLLFGRVYCSVVCPLGILQDVISRLGRRGKKNRFGWKPANTLCRWTVLAVWVTLFFTGFSAIAMLVAPYSLFGRIVSTFLSPLYRWGNNLLSLLPETVHDYWLAPVEISTPTAATLAVTAVLFLLVAILAWRGGRTYCNTFCPVGTVLGLVARFSFWKPRIDTDKCNGCGKCARNCKAACIDPKAHRIDASRCVACFDCLENCPTHAMRFSHPLAGKAVPKEGKGTSSGLERRQFLTLATLAAATNTAMAEEKKEEVKIKFDGGLAKLMPRQTPSRVVNPTPAGSERTTAFSSQCVACQLCVVGCPNHVLRSSDGLKTFHQPQMLFTQGYCRPECHHCSEVCPAGAIREITVEQKARIQIGYAVWMRDRCVVLTDGVPCGNCERHCLNEAITMIPSVPDDSASLKIPTVCVEKCIGCGSCEYHCPARPQSAIYVEGKEVHTEIQEETEVKQEKALVIYFSHSGNTRQIAEMIQKQTGADLFEVKSVDAYPADYDTVVAQAKKEIDAGFKPAIQKSVDNLAEYTTIYFGSPCWWSTIAPPLATLLTTADFSGKTIHPFMTHEGSGLGRSVADIQKYVPRATVQAGLAIFGHAVKNAETNVKNWLTK